MTLQNTCENLELKAEKIKNLLLSLRDPGNYLSSVEAVESLPTWMLENIFINSKDLGRIPLSFEDIPGSPVSFKYQGELAREFFIENQGRDYKLVKLKDRQIGSTTFWIAAAMTMSMHFPGYHGRIVFQDEKTAIEQKREKFDFMYANVPAHNRRRTLINNETQVTFDNGSMIFFDHILPAHKILRGAYRAFTCQYIIVTEAGYYVMGNEFWEAIRSSLATHGWIVIESTPKYHGWFRNMYIAARDGNMPGWKSRFLGRNELHGSEAGKAHIAAYIAENGEEAARREYPENDRDCWIAVGGYIFQVDVCEAMLAETRPLKIPRYSIDVVEQCLVEDTQGDLQLLEGPIKNDYQLKDRFGRPLSQDGRYIIAADVGSGAEADYDIAYIGNFDTHEVIGEYANNTIKPTQFADRLYLLGKWYNWALLMVEVTGEWGRQVVDRLRELKYPNQYVRYTIDKVANKRLKHYGFDTNSETRPIIIGRMQEKIRKQMFKMPFRGFWEETVVFIDNDGRPEAQENYHDDRVMTGCILNYGLETYIWRIQKEADDSYLGPHDAAYYFKGKQGAKVS